MSQSDTTTDEAQAADNQHDYTCTRCGAGYSVGVDGDAFTTITVSYHDDDREDFAQSFCQECGDELLADVVAETEE